MCNCDSRSRTRQGEDGQGTPEWRGGEVRNARVEGWRGRGRTGGQGQGGEQGTHSHKRGHQPDEAAEDPAPDDQPTEVFANHSLDDGLDHFRRQFIETLHD